MTHVDLRKERVSAPVGWSPSHAAGQVMPCRPAHGAQAHSDPLPEQGVEGEGGEARVPDEAGPVGAAGWGGWRPVLVDSGLRLSSPLAMSQRGLPRGPRLFH